MRKRGISASFVRQYRKSFLDRQGNPLPGCEQKADVLLDIVRLLQKGCRNAAVSRAWRYGLDLFAL